MHWPENDDHRRYEDRAPAALLVDHVGLFQEEPLSGPVLDLASGDCRNGIFLAEQNIPVICCDVSAADLQKGKDQAKKKGVVIETWVVDLEREEQNPLPEEAYGGITVFRYLHRPLMPCIKKALRAGGILVYETYTVDQPAFGKPLNPAFLLKPGELKAWFSEWNIIHYFEGIRKDPPRAVAQLVCRKSGYNTLISMDKT